MNSRIIIAILIATLIAVGIPLGTYLYVHQDDGHGVIDPLLKDNKAAQEISALGIEVDVEDLGTDGNGYTVLGQTRFVGDFKVVEVVLDDSVAPNSYEAHAILYHELGHVFDPNTDEAGADAYAQSRGYNITDAYHGIH